MALPTSNSTRPDASTTSWTSFRPLRSGRIDLLFVAQPDSRGLEAGLVGLEDDVERGDLLGDEAPLVHPPRPLEQERFRVDRDEEVLALGTDPRLEVEGAAAPGEQVVDRLLDLHPDVFLQLRAGDVPQLDQDFPELPVPFAGLAVHRGPELGVRDPAAPDQQVAEPVPPVDDRGEDDPAVVEVGVPEVLAVRDRQAAGLPAERQQLDDVREAGLLQAALDGHQRHSSIRRSPMSGHSQTRLLGAPEPARPDATRAHARGGARGARRGALQDLARQRHVGLGVPGIRGGLDPLHERLHRPHRFRRTAGEIPRELRVDPVIPGPQQALDHRLADLALRWRQVDHEATGEPARQSRREPLDLAWLRRRGERELRSLLDEVVEEEIQLLLRALVTGEQLYVVEQQGLHPPVARPPGPDPAPLERLDQLLGEVLGVQAGHHRPVRCDQQVADRMQQVGLADPCTPDDDERVVRRTGPQRRLPCRAKRHPVALRLDQVLEDPDPLRRGRGRGALHCPGQEFLGGRHRIRIPEDGIGPRGRRRVPPPRPGAPAVARRPPRTPRAPRRDRRPRRGRAGRRGARCDSPAPPSGPWPPPPGGAIPPPGG